ncbi:type 2 lanthipeptide synthetase LanM family protein [Streptomyces sp. NBC_00829]|uniref:type 2 lanthipeptide synthetase LanM family protein n=1 Tax=Streptomyces sp. NBC_00829 TaxID=2903679 RepID=UPI00386D04CA|nr:type 2 lanthipeptide synthetase LanM family protein [Streptomyces sp. NBC_00829]
MRDELVSEISGDRPSEVFQAWMRALQAHDPDQLRRRLRWDGQSPADAAPFLASLARADASDTFLALQGWLRSSTPIDASDAPLSGSPPVSFVELWQCIARGAMRELSKGLPAHIAIQYRIGHESWADHPGIHRDLANNLIMNLSAVGEPAVWEEFSRRRSPSDLVIAHLDSGESRGNYPRRIGYCAFLEDLRQDGLWSLSVKYPVLKRHLSTTVERWLQSSREILTRVHSDRHLLTKMFHLPADGRLTGIKQNLSDPHCGGRTVAILTFASPITPSASHHVVYKPKDLRIDREFQRLLADIPPPAPVDDSLRTVRVIARDGYGYMEWVPHRVCTNEGQLRSFYRNAGRLAAILHLLGCSDCHHENLIAQGDQLVLIDAETLFEGIPHDHNDKDVNPSASRAYRQIADSVIGTGLLPQWQFVGQQQIPRDVSALGIEPPQSLEQQDVGWIGLNTDGMIPGRIERPAHLPTSLPVAVGSRNRLGDFVEEFCDGFEHQLMGILADKQWWLADPGLIARFRTYPCRLVLRPTWLYIWLHRQQIEPAALESEIAQRLLLESLARSYVVSTERPRNWELFAAEVAQTENLDVPFFEQSIGGVDLVLPGGLTIADYFKVSGYNRARQRLHELDTASIALQLSIIRGVIAAKGMHGHHRVPLDRSSSNNPAHCEPSAEERRSESTYLGNLLVKTAIACDTGAVEWLGIHVAEDLERATYGPLGPSLYGGRSGIALFLATLALHRSANSDSYQRIAYDAVSDLGYQLSDQRTDDRYRWWRDQPLGLAGSGGVLLALLHLRELLPDTADSVNCGLSSLLDSLDTDFLRSDQQLDLMRGCAGLIGPLLKAGTPRALLLAQEAGDRLVDRQDACGGWVISSIGATALTGFSHGASGMATALARLHSVTGRSAYREAAVKALRYEREAFHPGERNWPDFRGAHEADRPRFMLSWCHGAPGVALSRLCMSQTALWDGLVEEELQLALASTADQTSAGDSLCCGRFGRAAILRAAARRDGERRWLDAAIRLEAHSMWLKRASGDYSLGGVPGLFQGAAGVGLALLDSVPGTPSSLLPSLLSAGLWSTRACVEGVNG